MAFQVRNPDGTDVPAGNASDTTAGIEGASIPILIGNIGLELTIAELLRLAPDQLSPADRNLLMHIAAYLVDFTITTQEVWNTATDAQLTVLDPNDAAATQAIGLLAAGSVPTLTGWAAQVTTTENRVIIARIPLANNAEDYRIHAVQGSSTTDQRLQYVTERARNSQYKFISTLSTERAGTFTAQHHGTVQHTEFGGDIGERGLEQIQARVDALLASILERLLPNASGGSVGQIAKIIEQSGVKSWAIGDDERGGGGGSLSDAQLAKLAAIATPPAEGERDTKGLIYEGNRTAWIIFDYLTRSEFRDYRPHTPDRGDTLPVHLLPQGTFVLQKTSHWSEKLYGFYLAQRDITIGGTNYRDVGTIEVPISSDWTVFEDSDNANPAIFSTTRVAGIVMRNNLSSEAGWRPKIIMDRALFPQQSGAYNYSGLSIRMALTRVGRYGQYHHAQLFLSAFNRDGDDISGAGAVTEIVAGGRTYICFVPDNRDFNWIQFLTNARDNNVEVAFQILKSKTASPVFPPTDPQFLSDDPATPWVDGDEFETGLYEGDANGHPQARVLPPLEEWNSLLARTIPYFSGTGPDPRAGVDGQFWTNLRTGEVWQKQSGSWEKIADIVLQAELNAALAGITGGNTEDWDDIPTNTSIPVGKPVLDDNLYYVSWTAHRKGATKPAADSGNWRLISNYLGGWRSGTYPAGILTFRGGNFYVSTRNIVPGNPSPTGTNGDDYWVQLDVQTEPARFIELSINSGLTVPEPTAAAAPLTFSSTLLQNVNSTGFLARNSAGNGITLKAGVYEINTHLVLNTSSANKRSTMTIEIFDGTNVISTKQHIDYLRNFNLSTQSVDSFHKINLTTDKTIQIRVKTTAKEDANVALTITTNSGVVTVSRD